MTAQKRERDLHSLTPRACHPETPFRGEGPREGTTIVQAGLCDPPVWWGLSLALGRWELKRASDSPHGRFTLILRKTPDGWRIVHDHTSAAMPPS